MRVREDLSNLWVAEGARGAGAQDLGVASGIGGAQGNPAPPRLTDLQSGSLLFCRGAHRPGPAPAPGQLRLPRLVARIVAQEIKFRIQWDGL